MCIENETKKDFRATSMKRNRFVKDIGKRIAEQEGKDVFEYSIFGNPEVKIGNFTQTKLGGF
jgi:hypothetical protein